LQGWEALLGRFAAYVNSPQPFIQEQFMEKTTRRMFCGTAILATPALTLLAKDQGIEGGFSDSHDPLYDALADEFTRVTADGAQFGFKSEHFRRYAGFMRIVNAHMEGKGLNRELNKRMDEDDFHRLDPVRAAKSTVEYWRKHNVEMREDDLTERLMMDWRSYTEIKKAIKKQGGVGALNAKVAEVFERKAKEYETSSFRGGPVIREGRISFPRQNDQQLFIKAQWEWLGTIILGFDIDCLCRAMVTTGAICGLICVFGVPVACIPSAFLLAFEKLMEGLDLCDPHKC
jgi:hypothetical protein